ncbi:hypothetical protein ACFSUT_47630, partial [Amycolatopsis albidoflavus]
MSEPFYLDGPTLARLMDKLRSAGQEMLQAQDVLQHANDYYYGSWGGDEIGNTFANQYCKYGDQALANGKDIGDAITQAADNTMANAKQFESVDQDTASWMDSHPGEPLPAPPGGTQYVDGPAPMQEHDVQPPPQQQQAPQVIQQQPQTQAEQPQMQPRQLVEQQPSQQPQTQAEQPQMQPRQLVDQQPSQEAPAAQQAQQDQPALQAPQGSPQEVPASSSSGGAGSDQAARDAAKNAVGQAVDGVKAQTADPAAQQALDAAKQAADKAIDGSGAAGAGSGSADPGAVPVAGGAPGGSGSGQPGTVPVAGSLPGAGSSGSDPSVADAKGAVDKAFDKALG